MEWDIIFFSETRALSQIIDLDKGHRLFLSLGSNGAAGVGILIHQRLVGSIETVKSISDRILRADLRLDSMLLTCYAVYIPHAGYPSDFVDQVFEQLQKMVFDAVKLGSRVVLLREPRR